MQAIGSSSQNFRDLYEQGVRLLEGRRHAEALDLFARVLGDPDPSAEAVGSRADIYMRLFCWSEALAELTRVIGTGSDDGRLYFARAICRSQLGDRYGAVSDFTAALERDGSLTEAYFRRGLTLLAAGDASRAILDLSHVLQSDTSDELKADAYWALAVADPSLAEHCQTEASRLDPSGLGQSRVQSSLEQLSASFARNEKQVINLMERLVEIEVRLTVNSLTPEVQSAIELADVIAWALNRLPACYVTSRKWEQQLELQLRAEHGEQIIRVVQEGIATVRRNAQPPGEPSAPRS